MTIKAIFFDLGDTLVNNAILNDELAEINLQAFKEMGSSISIDDVKSLFQLAKRIVNIRYSSPKKHNPKLYLKEMFELEGIKQDKDIIEKYSKMIREYRIDNSVLFDGTHELLSCLKKSFKLAIVSNSDNYTANKTIDKHDLRKYFDVVVISEDIGYEKNTGIPFENALHCLKLRPEEVIMIGDNEEEDIIPAKKLGMRVMQYK